MRWLAWAACLGLAAFIAVAVHAWQSPRITTQLQRIDHALVSAGGREVTVPALGGGCVRRVALTATETTRSVSLRLTAYSISGPQVACPADLRLLQASTRLKAPLGQRQLVDASTNQRVSYIPGSDLARPGWLPRGAMGPSSSPVDGWTRTYTFPKRMNRAPLTIVENPTVRAHPLGFGSQLGTVSHLTIDGHPATLLVERRGGRLVQDRIDWHADGYALTVGSRQFYADQRPLSPAVVRHVATALSEPHARPGAKDAVSTYDHIRFVRPPGWQAVPVTFASGAVAPGAYWTNQQTGPECRSLPNGGRCGPPVRALHRNEVLVIVGGPPFLAQVPFHANTTVAGRPARVWAENCSMSAPKSSTGTTCFRGAARRLVAEILDPGLHLAPGTVAGFSIQAYVGPGSTRRLEQQMRHVLATAHRAPQ